MRAKLALTNKVNKTYDGLACARGLSNRRKCNKDINKDTKMGGLYSDCFGVFYYCQLLT